MSTGELNEVNQPKFLTRTPIEAVDWDTFFQAVQDAFSLHLQSFGPPGQKAPILVGEYPKQNNGNPDTSFDVILFHMLGSERAGTDPSGTRRIPKGPNLRERKPHPTKDRYSLVTIGWWELMTARFTIYSLSRDRANELTKWFHLMMMRYTFFLSFFKARGIHDLRFLSRGEDKFSREYGQEFHTRTLDYTVRLELLQNFETKDFETVHVAVPETSGFDVSEEYQIPKP